MLLFLLDACPTSEPSTDTVADACNWDTPDQTDLAWDAPTTTGVSAADLLAWGIGTFTDTLTWDDGTTTELTLVTSPTGARELSYGPPDACLVSVDGFVAWTLTTADGRVDVTGEAVWSVEQALLDQDLGRVHLNGALDRATIGFEPLDATSQLGVGVFIDDGGGLDRVWVGESWEVDSDTTRVCVRASTLPDQLGCVDHDEFEGGD